jgi:hypothetical protein
LVIAINRGPERLELADRGLFRLVGRMGNTGHERRLRRLVTLSRDR